MQLQIESFGDVKVVRLDEPRLIFPLLGCLSAQIIELIELGVRKLVLNLSNVGYLDSASYGCLMDIYRTISERGGTMKLVGLQDRVETMARMIGITNLIEVFREEENALQSF
jgi:anti-anti-sigma factor